MKNKSKEDNLVTIGYDLDIWRDFGEKEEIFIDTSPKSNSHIILSGASGRGKTYCQNFILSKILSKNVNSKLYLSDYKRQDEYQFLKEFSRYFSYEKAIEGLHHVYELMKKRQSGEESIDKKIVFCFDEYVACMLALQNVDSKNAKIEMNMTSELLMLSRTMNFTVITSSQRPDASAYPSGARLNYGINIILGNASQETYKMLMPDYIEQIKGRTFGVGEGVVLLQGSELRFIKIPKLSDETKVQNILVDALTRWCK